MKITTDRKALTEALALMTKVADAKSIMPMLACVRIGTTDDGAELTATDLTTTAHARLAGAVHKRGSVAADARQLAALVKAAAGDYVTIEEDGASLRVGAAKMPTMHAPDFPHKLPTFAAESYGWTEPKTLAAALAKVLPCVSLDETRYHLNGVYLETDPSNAQLRMVSTDGHRLTLVKLDGMTFGRGPAQTGIVPRAAAQLIASACKRARVISCAILDGHFHVSVDGATIVVQLIDAQFPSYGAVIPATDSESRLLTVGRDALMGALAKARDVLRAGQKDSPNVALGMRSSALRVSAFSKDTGEPIFAADVAATYTGPSRSFAFCVNAEYLIGALATVSDETVKLSFGGGKEASLDPLRLDATDRSITCVVMPVRGSANEYEQLPEEEAPTAATAVQEAQQFVDRAKRTRAARKAKAPEAQPAAEPTRVAAPQAMRDAAPAPAPAALVAEMDPAHPLTATVEVAAGIVDAFMAFAMRAAANAATVAARECYRCHKVKPMGYVLDGQVCCRDCREAHRQDYYASRGQEARPRQPRNRRGSIDVAQTVATLHVRAEHVTVEPAPMGSA